MATATMRLIEAVENLNMSGEIGDGMVAHLHGLASLARLEQNPADVLAHLASKAGRVVDPERHAAMRSYCAEQVRLEPMRHRCETCHVVDGHMLGCAENEPCYHAWHAFPCPNSWGSICPGCGEAG